MDKIVCLLTARKGSSLKNKNTRKILGKPLISFPINEIVKSKKIDQFWVSSDCDYIKKLSQEKNFNIIDRPDYLSNDTALHVDVINHALSVINNDKSFKFIVIVLGNNPCIKSEWIDDCIDLLKKSSYSSVVPVYCENDFHPLRAKKLIDGKLVPFIESSQFVSSNRQDLQKCYFLSHNFWVIDIDRFSEKPGTPPFYFLGNEVGYYETVKTYDVHHEEDLIICEQWLKQNLI